jgi:hypothetical protein
LLSLLVTKGLLGFHPFCPKIISLPIIKAGLSIQGRHAEQRSLDDLVKSIDIPAGVIKAEGAVCPKLQAISGGTPTESTKIACWPTPDIINEIPGNK